MRNYNSQEAQRDAVTKAGQNCNSQGAARDRRSHDVIAGSTRGADSVISASRVPPPPVVEAARAAAVPAAGRPSRDLDLPPRTVSPNGWPWGGGNGRAWGYRRGREVRRLWGRDPSWGRPGRVAGGHGVRRPRVRTEGRGAGGRGWDAAEERRGWGPGAERLGFGGGGLRAGWTRGAGAGPECGVPPVGGPTPETPTKARVRPLARPCPWASEASLSLPSASSRVREAGPRRGEQLWACRLGVEQSGSGTVGCCCGLPVGVPAA